MKLPWNYIDLYADSYSSLFGVTGGAVDIVAWAQAPTKESSEGVLFVARYETAVGAEYQYWWAPTKSWAKRQYSGKRKPNPIMAMKEAEDYRKRTK